MAEQLDKSYEYNSSLLPGFWNFVNCESVPYNNEEIRTYMGNAQMFNKEIRNLAWWAYRVNGSVSSSVNYARSMHTLDSAVICKSTRKTKSKSGKPRNFSKNSALFNQVMELIRFKELVRDMLLKCCLDGTYFYYLETSEGVDSNKKSMSSLDVMNVREINSSDINVTVIPLPIDYCKIVGRKNNSYIMAFDLRYFTNHTSDEVSRLLRGMPAEIRAAYASYEIGKSDDWIILDNEHTLVGKIRTGTNSPWGEPLVIAALNDVLYADNFINTKRNVLERVNHQIIFQTFPEGAQKGTSALTGDQQVEQHNTVKDAVINASNIQGISFFSLPGGTKIEQLKVDTSIFSDDTESETRDNVAVDIGISPSVLNGKSTGNFATSTLNIDLFSSYVYTWIDAFVNEFNKAVQACVIKDSSCPVGVYVLPTTFANREKVVEQMSKLYTSGKGSLVMWVASTGVNPEAYLALMDYELSEGFEEKYPIHRTSYNSSDSADVQNSTGRPENDNPTNDNTITSKTNNANSSPKPST